MNEDTTTKEETRWCWSRIFFIRRYGKEAECFNIDPIRSVVGRFPSALMRPKVTSTGEQASPLAAWTTERISLAEKERQLRILLVEDEKELASALAATLGRHDVVVDHASNLAIAEEACRRGVHDAVLLDRNLPDGDGLSLIPLLRREHPGLPVIVLSALGSSGHRIAGLDHGADDYLAKPFSTDELMARLRAVMRRPAQIAPINVHVGRLQFNLTERHAFVDGAPLDLTRRELLALETLVRRAGRTVARTALEDAVYGYDEEIASNTLDSHISRLRVKLSGAGVEIHAIRGLGYLLRAAT